MLLRRVIGDALRARRQSQRRTLREVSTAANVSLGYLSEIERGQKEASSELLSAICEALGSHLSDILRDVSDTLAVAEQTRGDLAPAGQTRGVLTPSTRPRDGRPPAEAVTEPVIEPDPPSLAEPAQPAAERADAASQAGVDAASQVDPGQADSKAPARADAAVRPETARTASGSTDAHRGAARVRPAPVGHATTPKLPVQKATAARDTAARDVASAVRRRTVTDGQVSVSVRQDGPLRATLHSTRTVRDSAARDVVCV